MKFVVATLLSLLAVSNAMELTPETWDDAVAGKTVFIKFLAPCKFSCETCHPNDWSRILILAFLFYHSFVMLSPNCYQGEDTVR
jgi:hypothetical protein